MNPTKKRGIAKGVKNALKHADSRHSETQQVTYTPAEWQQVQTDMAAAGISTHTRYARRAVVNYREMQRVIAAAKELIALLPQIGIDFESHKQYAAFSDAVEIIKATQETTP